MPHHVHDRMTALQAKEYAQQLAFAPIAFQAARSMLQLNLLAELDQAGKQGLSAGQLAEKAGLAEYAGYGFELPYSDISSAALSPRKSRLLFTA